MIDVTKYYHDEQWPEHRTSGHEISYKAGWRVPKWEHWDKLIALLRLAGCPQTGNTDGGFQLAMPGHMDSGICQYVVSRELIHGAADPAINVPRLKKIFNQ